MIYLNIDLESDYGARFELTFTDKGLKIDQDVFDYATDEEILDAMRLFSFSAREVILDLHPKFTDTPDDSLYNAEMHVVNKLLEEKLDERDVRGFVEEVNKNWSFGR